jgi:ADP-heptose:LPS heptosyltransferase
LTNMANVIKVDKDKSWKDQDLGGDRKLSHKKSVCVVRYGGFGDMIQTAGLLPIFKRLGYYVTVNTNEKGYDILREDPHVDEFLVQPKDFVTGPELGGYWWKLHGLFDKFVNLSESVEATLLALEGRIQVQWSKKARHRYMNHNYMELMADIADIPYNGENGVFYATDEEKKWAKKQRHKMGKKAKVVLWSLSGSSLHKVNFWIDTVIARTLLQHPEVHFVLTGDEACKFLAGSSWKNEKRVHNWTGGDIRKTLAFLPECDLVIGPETGVLNAAGGLDDVKKVLFLSHSTEENVCKHWKNWIALAPTDCPCFPCHTLHKTNSSCTLIDIRDKFDVMIKQEWKDDVYKDILDKPIMLALCSIMVTDDMIYDAIVHSLYRSKTND